jgi:hypothetical protein
MSQYYPQYPQQQQTPQRNHSPLGVASFILSLVSGLILLVAIVAAGAMVTSNPTLDEESPEMIGLGCAILFFGFLELVALGLGIAGAIQASRSKVFAILGIVFSAVVLLGIAFLMVIGSSEM